MEKHVSKFIKKHNLNNKKIIIALSGGVDSVVLTDILLKLEQKIIIVHINHNKREQSAVEQNHIINYYKKYTDLIEVGSFEYKGGNFQEQARNYRQNFINKVSKKHNCNCVFTAHHANDQVETILLKIKRNSSLDGISGMKEHKIINSINYYKPLLDISKKEIYDYAKLNNLTYFEDESNQSDDYTRNFYRNNIVSKMVENDANIINAFSLFSKKLSELVEYNNKHIESLEINNSVSKLLEQGNTVVNQYIINMCNNLNLNISKSTIEEIKKILKSEKPNLELQISDDYVFIKEYDNFYIDQLLMYTYFNMSINKIGEYDLPNFSKLIIKEKDINNVNSNAICYNSLNMVVRNKQNGDKILLEHGTVKLKDYFIKNKIPASKRREFLLLVDDNSNEVLSILGIRDSLTIKQKNYPLQITYITRED